MSVGKEVPALGAGSLIKLAVATAYEAGEVLAAGRRGNVEVAHTKSSATDVVTVTDVAAEELIRLRLLTARPADGFVGEEGDDIVGTSGVVWIVDPIDGTVNFLYGIPAFAVAIAAERNGVVEAGVVHNPASGETFTAVRGEGAWLDGRRLEGSDCTEVAQALVGTGFSYRAENRAAQAQETARLLPLVRDIRRIGSAALDLCFVACGRYDAYVERGLKRWDLQAARLVVLESGGRVEGLAGADPSELLVTAASARLYDKFHAALIVAGYAEWPLG